MNMVQTDDTSVYGMNAGDASMADASSQYQYDDRAGSPESLPTSHPSSASKPKKAYNFPAADLKGILESASLTEGSRAAMIAAKEAERRQRDLQDAHRRAEDAEIRKQKQLAITEKRNATLAAKKAAEAAGFPHVPGAGNASAYTAEGQPFVSLQALALPKNKALAKVVKSNKPKNAARSEKSKSSASAMGFEALSARAAKGWATRRRRDREGTPGSNSSGRHSPVSLMGDKPVPVANYDYDAPPVRQSVAATKAAKQAQAQAQAVTQTAEDEEDDRLYCICQKKFKDEPSMMMACERCEDWYHFKCLGIEEALSPTIDAWYCHNCVTADPTLCTTYKPECIRENCREAAVGLSKYCSDWCGLKLAADRLAAQCEQSNMGALLLAIRDISKIEAKVQIIKAPTESGHAPDFVDSERPAYRARMVEMDGLQTALGAVVEKRQKIERAISLAIERLNFLGIARNRADAACRAFAAQSATQSTSSKPTKNKNKNKNAASGQTSEAPCGFDVRLVWDEQQFADFLQSPDYHTMQERITDIANEMPDSEVIDIYQRLLQVGNAHSRDDDDLICDVSRRKCDRHAGWAKLREADFEGERVVLMRQLDNLTQRESRLRRIHEDAQEVHQRIEDRHQRNGLKVVSHVTGQTNEDDVEPEVHIISMSTDAG